MREFQNYKILIIDDDETAILQLEKALKKHPLFTVAGVAKNAEKGEQLLFAQRPDILFLDVELPDAQGVEFLNSIKDSINWSMYVVFYSMHSKYILSAFRESAFDYLLKPFEQEELDGILERFRKTVITIETQAMQRKADENPLATISSSLRLPATKWRGWKKSVILSTTASESNGRPCLSTRTT